MAREKVTIMAERRKIERVRRLTGATSASDAIDRALDELLRLERIRRDIAAYAQHPPTLDEAAFGSYRPSNVEIADDTDWESVYADVTD